MGREERNVDEGAWEWREQAPLFILLQHWAGDCTFEISIHVCLALNRNKFYF